MPDGHRPFEKFELIIETLVRLDPENDQHFYFDFSPGRKRSGRPDAPPKVGSVEHYVDLAAKIDHAARVMIEHLINDATEVADQPITRKLIKRRVRDHDGQDIEALRRLLEAKDFRAAMDEASCKLQEKRLRDRIARLDGFLSVASITRRDYQEKLRRLQRSKLPAGSSPKKTTNKRAKL